MSRLLLLSNGHGEDLSGALLGGRLRDQGLEVEALPLVGLGRAYRQVGIPVLGRPRQFSTGGLGYTSVAGRLAELRQGQLTYLLGLLLQLWRQRRRYQLVLAVGDLVPVLGAWLSGRPTAVYLVAYSSHYEGRLRLPWPCGWLLRSRRFRCIWSRDALTAVDLTRQLGRSVSFLGNPFLDAVQPSDPQPPVPTARTPAPPRLALLPGSRLPEALHNLALLLGVLSRLPAPWRRPGALELQVALVGELTVAAIASMAAPLGWRLEQGNGGTDGGAGSVLSRDGLQLQLHWGRFPAVLGDCDLVLSMTGTAAEQAVGLGKPVLQLAGHGPQFTAGFAEAQRRLLGPGLFCAPGPAGHDATLAATARLAGELLARTSADGRAGTWRQELRSIGAERIGSPGGTDRMAAAIMELLSSNLRAPDGEHVQAPRSHRG